MSFFENSNTTEDNITSVDESAHKIVSDNLVYNAEDSKDTELTPSVSSDSIDQDINKDFHYFGHAELCDDQSNIDKAIVKGIVIDKSPVHILVDIGLKSEGSISRSEFSKEEFNDINIGDSIEVYVISANNPSGDLLLSYEKKMTDQKWKYLEECKADNRTVEGKIVAKTRKGFIVNVDRFTGFLLFNNIDINPGESLDSLIDTVHQFHIVKLDSEKLNIILAKKMSIEQQKLDKATSEKFVDLNIEEGQVITGVIRNITNYGAFVDIGNNIGGLLHISDISWSRIQKASDLFTPGQEVKVKVLSVDMSNNRISLGMKQLTSDPWDEYISKYKVGDKVKGTIVCCMEYGAFVEIEPGVEGLIHASELDWNKRHSNASQYFNPKDVVEAVILSINNDDNQRRIALSVKQMQPNPAKLYLESNPIGTKVSCQVLNVMNSGISLSIEGTELKGFIHAYELNNSPNKRGGRINKKFNYNKKDKLEAIIIGYEENFATINLSIRKLIANRFEDFKHKVGDIVDCSVCEVAEQGIGVKIKDYEDIQCFIKNIEFSTKQKDTRSDSFKIGHQIKAMVIYIDTANSKVYLSTRAVDDKEVADILNKYDNEQQNESMGVLFGDLEESRKN